MRVARPFAAVLVIALFLCIPAQGEVTEQGNLITTFQGALTPKTLPRETPAPVAVSVAGDFKTTAHAVLPQLRTISLAINSAGVLEDTGLPTCRVSAIQPATEGNAKALCHKAIVGTGHVTVDVRLENQAPFSVDANPLAFNGPTENGQKLILAQVYAKDPPGAFVLTFRLKHPPRLFGTVMSMTLPHSAQGSAYLSHFDMTLYRHRYRGKAHSYVSAACPGAVLPLAKAGYGFAGGRTLRTTVVRSCQVAGE
jgi:hypothetical protein